VNLRRALALLVLLVAPAPGRQAWADPVVDTQGRVVGEAEWTRIEAKDSAVVVPGDWRFGERYRRRLPERLQERLYAATGKLHYEHVDQGGFSPATLDGDFIRHFLDQEMQIEESGFAMGPVKQSRRRSGLLYLASATRPGQDCAGFVLVGQSSRAFAANTYDEVVTGFFCDGPDLPAAQVASAAERLADGLQFKN
jgi:hypothetical protein